MIRKLLFVLAFALLPLGSWAQSSLPPCPASGYKHNCYGSADLGNQRYTGEFQQGKFNGSGSYIWPDGRRYDGQFKDGTFHGIGRATTATGLSRSFRFNNGIPDDEGFPLEGLSVPASLDITTCSHDDLYPRQSRVLGEQGSVVVRFKVDLNREISEIGIEKSSGYSRLDRAAVRLVATCKGRPSFDDGKQVIGYGTYEVRWVLN